MYKTDLKLFIFAIWLKRFESNYALENVIILNENNKESLKNKNISFSIYIKYTLWHYESS